MVCNWKNNSPNAKPKKLLEKVHNVGYLILRIIESKDLHIVGPVLSEFLFMGLRHGLLCLWAGFISVNFRSFVSLSISLGWPAFVSHS